MSDFRNSEAGTPVPGARAAENETFAQSVGDLLRQPERLAAGFDSRVLARIQEERASIGTPDVAPSRPAHLLSSFPFRSGPVLALAASLTIAAFAAGAVFARANGGAVASSSVVTPADTVYLVRFVFHDAGATRVTLVGSFNAWSEDATPLRQGSSPGVWTATVRLTPGVHEYSYLVDGDRWELDPTALAVADPLGIESSVIRVRANGYTGL
jgi:hypothetical protein